MKTNNSRYREVIRIQDFPEIRADEREKKIEIAGYSNMVNPLEYYDNLMQTIEYYYQLFDKNITINFKLEFLNTLSVKLLFSTLSMLQNMSEKGGFLGINWYYEEDDEIIQELGEVLRSSLKIPVVLREISV